MNFQERLRIFRLQSHLTQQQLSLAVGVSATTIRNWESGIKQPSMAALIALSDALHISTDVLLGLTPGREPRLEEPLSKPEASLLKGYRRLDKYGKRAVETICAIECARVEAEGKIIRLDQDSVKPSRYIPKYYNPPAAGFAVPLDGADFEMLQVDDETPDEADYAVEIHGRSMEPFILDGETVYVKSCEELRSGDVGIFSVDGAMVCKQYYPREDGTLMLLSANRELRQSNVIVSPDSSHSVVIQGKVLLDARVPLPDYLAEDELTD